MNRDELKNFILDFYDAWKVRDKDRILPFYNVEKLKAYSDFEAISFDDIMNRLAFSKEKFAEVNYHIEDLIIDEVSGKISIRMRQRHTLKTGERVKWEAIMLYRIEDRKIVELWMSFFPNARYLDNTQFSS